jgi:uncharacterized protein YidB (DUF937 family)
MDVKELLGSAVKEAQKHPELLKSVVGFVTSKAGGSKTPAKKGAAKGATSTGGKGSRPGAKKDEGLMGILGDLDLAGLAKQASSWVGTGTNEKVSGKQVEAALGKKKVVAAAKKAGISEKQAADGIAQLLPAVVDYLTPDGKVPTKAQAAKRLDTLAKAKT